MARVVRFSVRSAPRAISSRARTAVAGALNSGVVGSSQYRGISAIRNSYRTAARYLAISRQTTAIFPHRTPCRISRRMAPAAARASSSRLGAAKSRTSPAGASAVQLPVSSSSATAARPGAFRWRRSLRNSCGTATSAPFFRASWRSCAATCLAPENRLRSPGSRGAPSSQRATVTLGSAASRAPSSRFLGALKVSNSSINTARSRRNSGRLCRASASSSRAPASSSRSEGSMPLRASRVS